jgi:hypothetical protein
MGLLHALLKATIACRCPEGTQNVLTTILGLTTKDFLPSLSPTTRIPVYFPVYFLTVVFRSISQHSFPNLIPTDLLPSLFP